MISLSWYIMALIFNIIFWIFIIYVALATRSIICPLSFFRLPRLALTSNQSFHSGLRTAASHPIFWKKSQWLRILLFLHSFSDPIKLYHLTHSNWTRFLSINQHRPMSPYQVYYQWLNPIFRPNRQHCQKYSKYYSAIGNCHIYWF